jgi:superfamily II DNA helicase RecQ
MFRRKDGDYRRLDAVVQWAGGAPCLRAALLSYFGESLPENHQCGNCSACDGGTGDLRRAADLDEVERILEVLGSSPPGITDLNPTLVARFLSGSRSKRIPPDWKELPEFGVFSSVPIGQLRELSRLALSRRVAAPAAARVGRPAGGEVFWSSKHRSFDREELGARQVERQRGLLILEVAEAARGGLAPSRIAGVLRGSGRGDWKPGSAIPHQGALDVPYDELLPDVLAMWAKGYLEPIFADAKKLVLSEKGREVLKGRKQ